MHPGYMWYRKQRQACGASAYASAWCAPPTTPAPPEWHFSGRSRGGDAVFGSGSFGMRRPVRFLAERLELDELCRVSRRTDADVLVLDAESPVLAGEARERLLKDVGCAILLVR